MVGTDESLGWRWSTSLCLGVFFFVPPLFFLGPDRATHAPETGDRSVVMVAFFFCQGLWFCFPSPPSFFAVRNPCREGGREERAGGISWFAFFVSLRGRALVLCQLFWLPFFCIQLLLRIFFPGLEPRDRVKGPRTGVVYFVFLFPFSLASFCRACEWRFPQSFSVFGSPVFLVLPDSFL